MYTEHVRGLRHAEGTIVSPLPSKTVIVVDDEPVVREMLATLVSQAGYIPQPAESGEEALEILDAIAPDTCFVISDVLMGGMDGFDLAKRVRAKHPTMPILLISGYIEESHDLASLPEGVEFRRKPIDVHEIKALVEASCNLT